MKKSIFFTFFLIIISSFPFYAQQNNPNYCDGEHFYDSGGPDNNYLNNENTVTVISPPAGYDAVSVKFYYRRLESADHLYIYNGNTVDAPLLLDSSVNYYDYYTVTANNYTGSLTFQFVSNGYFTYQGWDAVVTCINYSCDTPGNLQVSNITPDSALITWDEDDATQWELAYCEAGDLISNATIVPLNTNQYNLTGLDPDTDYEIRVRRLCTSGSNVSYSGWTFPFKFTTSCPAFVAPYFEDVESFEDSHYINNNCWESFIGHVNPLNQDVESQYHWRVVDIVPSPYISYGTPNAHSGSKCFLVIKDNNAFFKEYATLTSPFVDISNLNNPYVSFYYYMRGHYVGALHVDIYSDFTWHEDVLVIENQQQIYETEPWIKQGINLSDFSSPVRIRFRTNPFGLYYYFDYIISIDDISFEEADTCTGPYNVKAVDRLANQVTLQWFNDGSQNQWEIEYGTPGFTQGNGTVLQSATNSFILAGLDEDTTYEAYIRRVCDASSGLYSDWTGPFSFSTTPEYCNCGNYFYDTGGPNGPYPNGDNLIQLFKAPPGTNTVKLKYDFIDVSQYERFYYFNGPDTSYPLMSISEPSTNPQGAITFHFLSDYDISPHQGWKLKATCFDKECIKPEDLYPALVSDTAVELDWKNGGNETQWEIEYGPAGFEHGNGTLLQVNSKPYKITGLNPQTVYDFYIRSYCGNDIDVKNRYWTKLKNITTSSSPVTAPYFDSFERYGGIDNHAYIDWSVYPQNNWRKNFLPTFVNSYHHHPVRFAKHGGFDLLTIFENEYPDQILLISPPVDLSTLSSPYLSFYYYFYNISAVSNEDVMHVDVYYNNTWYTDVFVDYPANYSTNKTPWMNAIVPLDAYSGVIQVRFRMNKNRFMTGIDVFSILNMDDCWQPENLDILPVSTEAVSINWNDDATQSQWEIEYGPQGFTQGSGTSLQISEHPYTLSGLTSGTDYDLYIKSSCANTNAGWAGPFSFSTPVDYCAGQSITSPGYPSSIYNTVFQRVLIAPSPGNNQVSIDFNNYNISTYSQKFYVFNGNDNQAPYTILSDSNPGTITADNPSGCLTLFYYSDYTINNQGYSASVSCTNSGCLSPSNLQVTDVTTDEAKISWEYNYNQSQWEIEYGQAGFAQGTGTLIQTNTPEYTLTGLTADTGYEVYVRANCDATSNSNWIGPLIFHTSCNVLTAPFFDDVESHPATTNGVHIGNCWTANPYEHQGYNWHVTDNGDVPNSSSGPSVAHSGTHFFYTDDNAPEGTKYAQLETPYIDISGLNNPYLSFYYFLHGYYIKKLSVDVWNNNTWHNNLIVLTDLASTDWQIMELPLHDYQGIIKVRFNALKNNSLGYDNVAIDDIRIDEGQIFCPVPENFEVSNVLTDQVDVSWTTGQYETQWEIEYGPAGFTQGTGTILQTNNNNINIANLSPDTSYDIYLRAVCDANTSLYSDWLNLNVTTDCLPLQAPFFEDVETFTSLDEGRTNCWENFYFEETYYPSLWKLSTTGTTLDDDTGPDFAHSGTHFFYLNGSYTAVGFSHLITPPIDISALSQPYLSFYYHKYSGDETSRLIVDINDNGNWVNNVLEITGEQQTSGSDPWRLKSLDLGNYSGVIRIRFRGYNGTTRATSIALDDIKIDEEPACPVPNDFTVVELNSDSVELDWNETGNANQWEIEYGTPGFTPGTGTVVQANTHPFVLTGLDIDTGYDIYLRSQCNTNQYSDSTSPLGITTLCDVYTAPYSDNFETHTQSMFVRNNAGNCWHISASSNFIHYEDAWKLAEAPGILPQISAYDGNNYFYANFYDIALESPEINVANLTNPSIRFQYIVHGVELHVDVAYNGVWQQDQVVIKDKVGQTNNWLEQFIDLNQFTGTIKVRFRKTSDDDIISGSYMVAIDNFIVDEAPSCPPPTGLSFSDITPDSVELNWDQGTASQWQIEYGTTGFTQGNGTMLTVNSNPSYVLNGLNHHTEYEVYLRANCGTSPGMDDSEWVGPYRFTTLPDYCAGEHFYDPGGPTGNYDSSNITVTTIYPPDGYDYVSVNFLSFNLSDYDLLRVYDGKDDSAPMIHQYSGTYSPGTIVPTNYYGCLTFIFYSNSTGTSSGWDAEVNCHIITCPVPTDFTVSNVLGTQVDLSWTNGGNETQWQIEYGTTGFTQGTGTLLQVNSNPYTLTGLDPLTSYDVYLRANCGANPGDDDSSWIGPLSFTTGCDTIAPYFEDVSNIPTSTEGVYSTCWYSVPYPTLAHYRWNAGIYTPTQNTGPNYGHSGAKFFYTEASSPAAQGEVAELYSLPIDITNLSYPELSFYYYMYGQHTGSLHVDLFYNNTWHNDVFSISGQQQTSGNQNWLKQVIDLTNTADYVTIRFRSIRGNGNKGDIAIDDIAIDESLGVNQLSYFHNLKVYPNPAGNYLNLSADKKIDQIFIMNLTGQELLKLKPAHKQIKVDITKLKPGTYLIKVSIDNSMAYYKFIKK